MYIHTYTYKYIYVCIYIYQVNPIYHTAFLLMFSPHN